MGANSENRPDDWASKTVQIGAVEVDFARNVIVVNGSEIRLEPKQALLLAVLIKNNGHVLTRDKLIETVWNGAAGSDQSLTNTISQLRRNFSECSDDEFKVETIPKRGYRLTANLELTGLQSNIHEHSAARPKSIWRSTEYKVFGAGLIALLIGFVFYLLSVNNSNSDVLSGRNQFQIIVFDRPDHPASQQKLTDSVKQKIAAVFSTNQLVVGPDKPAPRQNPEFQIVLHGEQKDKDFVLRAEVRQTKIDAQFWTFEARRNMEEVAIFEEQFSRKLASILQCFTNRRLNFNNNNNPELLNTIARHCEFTKGSSVEFVQMPQLARRYIEIAPEMAASHAHYGSVLAYRLLEDADLPADEFESVRDTAYFHLHEATKLDPNMGVAWWGRAIIPDTSVPIDQRIGYLRRALDEDPAFPYSRNHMGHILQSVGRGKDALSYYGRFVYDFPLDEQQAGHYALQLMQLGQRPSALSFMNSLLDTYPDSVVLNYRWFWGEFWFGDADNAREILARLPFSSGRKDCFEQILSARDESIELSVDEINKFCPNEIVWRRIQYYAVFGHIDKAFDLLNKHQHEFAPPSKYFNRGRLFYGVMAPVHNDPRFFEFSRDIGLVDYWVSTDNWPDFCKREDLSYNCKELASQTTKANDQ